MAQTEIDKRYLPLPLLPADVGLSSAEIVNQIDTELGNTEWKSRLTSEQVQDIVGAMAVGGNQSNITVTYDDANGTLNFTVSGGGAGLDQEQVEDIVDNLLIGGTGITATYDDGPGTLTLSLSGEDFTTAYRDKLEGIDDNATANSTDSELRDRSTHTGSQTASTISDFSSAVANTASVIANTAKRSYPVGDQSKLLNIEDSATGDQTPDEIRDALETLSGVNRLDSTAIQNLPNGVTNLTWDSNSGQGVVESDTGTDAVIPTATGGVSGTAGLLSRDDKDKLDGIESNSTADQTGPEIKTLLDVELANSRWDEQEIPAGGTTGQILKKNSNTDFDYSWQADEVADPGSGATQLSELTDIGTATPTNKNVLVGDGTDFDSRQLVADDISDFDTEVGNNPTVAANTAKRSYPIADENKLANITLTQPINLDTGVAKLSAANLFTNTNSFQNTLLLDRSVQLKPSVGAIGGSSYSEMYVHTDNTWRFESTVNSTLFSKFNFTALTADRTITVPDADVDLLRVLNEGKFAITNVSTNFTITDQHVQVQAGADIGKKVILTATGSNTANLTIDANSIDIGATAITDTDSTTSTINVLPASGQTLIGTDLDGTNTNVRLTGGYRRAVFTRKDASTIRVDGDYTTYEPAGTPVEIYTTANAASDPNGNEANTTTGWTGTRATVTSTADPSAGSYAIRVVATDVGGGLCYGEITLTTETGETYDISYDYKMDAGSTNAGVRVLDQTGYSLMSNTVTSYTGRTGTFTANGTSIRLQALASLGSGDNGDAIQIDNISIVKTS